jgi:glutathione S-transferase
MSLTFYYAPYSTASITQAVIAELGITCEHIKLDIDAGETRTPDFLALNPNGRVPTIVHDGVAIWESAAITIYLGETFGTAHGLYPEPGPRRGAALKWIVWANVALAEAAGRLSAALPAGSDGAVQSGSVDFIAPELRDPDALPKAQADVATCLGILDTALASRPFLLGNYSLADTHLQGFVGWIGAMGVDLSRHPHVTSWATRCSQRPALAGLMGDGQQQFQHPGNKT